MIAPIEAQRQALLPERLPSSRQIVKTQGGQEVEGDPFPGLGEQDP